MRRSTYEIILPIIGGDEKEIEGKALLVNGLYGSIDVVDREVAEAVEKDDVSSLPFADQERLALRGHITRKDEAGELADAKLLGRIWRTMIGRSGLGPIILPTFDCNFRCPYCFERHRLTRGDEWLGKEMSPEMVEAVFAAIQKQKDKGRKVESISLYGGEPLLKSNIETVRNICEHAKAMGLTISAITNGYDLDAYAEILKEYNFTRLQITVDGVGEKNDRRRLHKDGLPTYDRIMKNVQLALDCGVNVMLRVNTNRDNIDGVKALIDDIKARGLKLTGHAEREEVYIKEKEAKAAGKEVPKRKGFFSFYFKAVSEPVDSPTRVTEKQVFDEILKAGIDPMTAIEMQSQYSLPAGIVFSMMKKDDYPSFSTAFCGAEQGACGVGPDGKLFSCWDLVALDDVAIGFVDMESRSFIYNFDKAKWLTRTSDIIEKCQTCPYIFLCRGGCAAEAKHAHDNYFRESCGEFKEIFSYVFSRIAGRKWQKTKEEELSVSLIGPLSRLTEAEREILIHTTSQREMLEIIKEVGILCR